MRPGPFACALFGLVFLACSRTDLSASLSGVNDAGAGRPATSTQTTPSSMHDAAAIQEAGAIADDGDDGADGATCAIPAKAVGTSCQVVMHYPDVVSPCGRGQYQLYCSEAPDPSLACGLLGGIPAGGVEYCCPCAGTDAGAACVNIDLSSYDRSCTRDSDCIEISTTGFACCVWDCSSAAINVEAGAQYERAIAGLPSCGLSGCANDSGPRCDHGVCVPSQGASP